MDNENKDFQGVENENTLTPEEKVREDIRSKIADAAAEVQDEITEEASATFEEADLTGETDAEVTDSWNDESWEEGIEEVKPEPVKVTVKRSSFIISLICSAVVGALILLLGFSIPNWVTAMPEGKTVATVNGKAITDMDLTYQIYAEAMTYAQENGISSEELADYDWEQEVDGVKLSDTIKERALNNAVDELLIIQKGAENNITFGEADKAVLDAQIQLQLANISLNYGENAIELFLKQQATPTLKQFQKVYTNLMTAQNVQEDMDENPENYYPEASALNQYKSTDKASVKHILISKEADTAAEVTETVEGETPAPAEAEAPVVDKMAIAEQVLQRAQNGEDFDSLVEEFGEDPGQSADGYTFGPGEMMPEFEEAAFALGIDEISGIVETDYGYHIIKRIPGDHDLYNYWRESAGKKIKIKDSKIKKISITDILKDSKEAYDELISLEEATAEKNASK